MIGCSTRESRGFNPTATPTGTVQIVPIITATVTPRNVSPVTLPTCSQPCPLNCSSQPTTLSAPHPTQANAAIATTQPAAFRASLPNSSEFLGSPSTASVVTPPEAVARATGGAASATNGVHTRVSTQRSN